MPVLNLSYARIKDPAAFADYVLRAAEIMADFQVEVVGRGEFAACMAGTAGAPTVGAVFRYPSMAEAEAFFASPRYQALIPLRERACEMTILLFVEGG